MNGEPGAGDAARDPIDPSEAAEDPSEGAERPVSRHRLRRRILFGVLFLVLVALAVSSLVSIPEYAITPGTALNVGGLIAVPSANSRHHGGSVLLTDVELVPLRAIDWVFYRFNSNDEIVPNSELIGPLTTAQYDEEGVIDMSTARQAATVVALNALGYHVGAVPNGVVDYQPEPGSPASKALAVGDVITAIDGHQTDSLTALQSAIQSRLPGSSLTMTTHLLGSSTPKQVTMRLGVASVASSTPSCLPLGEKPLGKAVVHDGHDLACIGLYLDQLYATTGAPFKVTIDSEGIIGPSAGLAFTLGLIEKLDAADLTGGRRIAATGTMAINGAVGDVGGVAQKTVAVRNAGATVFLVPPQEYAVARAHAGSTLKIVAVSTIAQAVAALEHLGGRIVRPSTP